MTTQSEAILENNLIQQLVGLGYAPVGTDSINTAVQERAAAGDVSEYELKRLISST
jgi:hypothetical protein